MSEDKRSLKSPLRVIAVGAGSRTTQYCHLALRRPDRMQVVGVADPNEQRRRRFAQAHGLPAERQFGSYEQVAARPRLADAVINGTLDDLHHASAVALLRAGYHMLLEKPIARTPREVQEIVELAAEQRRIVMICHVLRYTPFYRAVKRLIDDGAVGQIVALHTSENVSYHHMATAFVRGKWNNEARSTPMIIAKCCHDTDMLAWLAGNPPLKRIASVGRLSQFREENAPAGSGARCVGDCRIEPECPYSAKRLYVAHGLWKPYVHVPVEHITNRTDADVLASLAGDNPYGRCVWRCDNDVVDHQHVIVEFANGMTASHNMLCATSRPTRTVHIVGSLGEIEGDFGDGTITLRRHRPHDDAMQAFDVTRHDIGLAETVDDGHGGGDVRLVEDFVATTLGEPGARSITRVEASYTGFAIAYYAHQAMVRGQACAFEPRPLGRTGIALPVEIEPR